MQTAGSRVGFAFDRRVCYATGDRKLSSGVSRSNRSETIGLG